MADQYASVRDYAEAPYGDGGATIAERTSLASELERLDKALSETVTFVEHMCERFGPILGPVEPTPEAAAAQLDGPTRKESDHVERVRMFERRVRMLRSQLAELDLRAQV